MERVSLVLGGTGFLGYYILSELLKKGKKARAFGIDKPTPGNEVAGVEYIVGDVFSEQDLNAAMKDVDIVYCFISTSMPNSGEKNLRREIDLTLTSLDCVLTAMVNNGISRIVFPSSGGAIYGDKNDKPVTESSALDPKTAYGTGKQMSEALLGFYHRRFGINTLVFRIGNVYGSKQYRKVQQGVIDVFIQSALQDEPIKIWGDANKSIRDYIYLADAAEAIIECALKGIDGYQVFNLGTGNGISVEEIIAKIERQMGHPLKKVFYPERSSGVSSIVLDCSKIERMIAWKPKVDIDTGIALTIQAKRMLLESNV